MTTVHVVRHGEVHNPAKVLYGRLPGYHLSDLGREMAEVVGEALRPRPVGLVVSSPLERAQETAEPIAAAHGLEIQTDRRLIEAGNHFQGLEFGVGDGSLKHPQHWRYLTNPFKPSWGEPYAQIVRRMLGALADARDDVRALGDPARSEAVLVSHQLPVWIVRSAVEGKKLWHDPRRRQCTLASVTSFTYDDHDVIIAVTYTEPAKALLPVDVGGVPKFSAGA